MKSQIGIATVDGISVSEHLARSAAFLVLGVEDGAIVSHSIRTRGTGPCGNHMSFLELLDGCQTVICGGISQSMFDLLHAHGIEPVVAAGPFAIDDAVHRFLAGTLPTSDERLCLCH
ncbi:MAG TPA: NifB/NifX family molybdenum-iron cluster-binding protein [Bryobacteraceae bacterium]|nr:NifB/NifX family molybdenum-iron cluster-binding protein [Bryobacteraceae bacterium]